MIDGFDHFPMHDLRIAKDLLYILDGAMRDVGGAEQREPVRSRESEHNRLDLRNELVPMKNALCVGGEKRV